MTAKKLLNTILGSLLALTLYFGVVSSPAHAVTTTTNVLPHASKVNSSYPNLVRLFTYNGAV